MKRKLYLGEREIIKIDKSIKFTFIVRDLDFFVETNTIQCISLSIRDFGVEKVQTEI